jgi:ArsR family transcriptional regulator, arsenate/arsenite/antimonite-responsive transcriptional repressor
MFVNMCEEPDMPPTPLPLATSACCGIGVDGGLDREAAETSAALLKAVADPVRLQLLSAIRATDAGEACVCDLTPLVGLSQPTVSHHLKVLRQAGLVDSERRGLWAYYYVIPEALEELSAWLS